MNKFIEVRSSETNALITINTATIIKFEAELLDKKETCLYIQDDSNRIFQIAESYDNFKQRLQALLTSDAPLFHYA